MEIKQLSIKDQLSKHREAAFRRLYEQVFPVVARLIAAKGGDLDLAKDIFQEAMIIYFEKVMAEKVSLSHSPKAYITGIARNLWLQHCKKDRLNLSLGELEEAQLEAGAFDSPPGHRKKLLAYLARAGQKCMDLLQAFYYFKTPMREIAEEFGYGSERSATVQKYKCLEKVRDTVKNSAHAEVLA